MASGLLNSSIHGADGMTSECYSTDWGLISLFFDECLPLFEPISYLIKLAKVFPV